jgi:hypothetical protein
LRTTGIFEIFSLLPWIPNSPFPPCISLLNKVLSLLFQLCVWRRNENDVPFEK